MLLHMLNQSFSKACMSMRKSMRGKNLFHKFFAKVAQLVEHTPEKRGVASSILALGTLR